MRKLAPICLTAAVSLALAAKADQPDPIVTQLPGYSLNESNVDKVVKVDQKLASAVEKDPSLAKKLKTRDQIKEGYQFDDIALHAADLPPASGVLGAVGISKRDYVLTSLAMMQGETMAEVVKDRPKSRPPDGTGVANNLGFVEKHPELTRRWMDGRKALQEAGGSAR